MLEFTIYIPVRNAAKWIGQFLDAYRALGVEPLYIVDSRTSDRTIEILAEKSARIDLYELTGDFIEAGMIEHGARLANTSWVLRFDADEFPSRSLIENARLLCQNPNYDSWWLQRKEIVPREGGYVTAIWQARVQTFEGEYFGKVFTCYPQLRLFNKEKVKFINKVHTPGIVCGGESGMAGPETFFAHFQSVLLSPEERLSKVRRYAKHDFYLAWLNSDEYFFELLRDTAYVYETESIDEFLPLLDRLPLPEFKEAELTSEEYLFLVRHVARSLGDSLSLERRRRFDVCIAMDAERKAMDAERKEVFHLIDDDFALLLIKKSAEIYLTLGRLFRISALSEKGERLYKSYFWASSRRKAIS